jgi:hypothetical protein
MTASDTTSTAKRRVHMVLGGLLHNPGCFEAARRAGLSAELIDDPVLRGVLRLISRGPIAARAAIRGSDVTPAAAAARKLHADSIPLDPAHIVALVQDLVAHARSEAEHLEFHEIAPVNAARFKQAVDRFEASNGGCEEFRAAARLFTRTPGLGLEAFEVLVRAAARLVAAGVETEDKAVELLFALGDHFDPKTVDVMIRDAFRVDIEKAPLVGVEDAPALVPDDRTERPTPQTVIEAVLVSVRARGLAALREPANLQRLVTLDDAARAQINTRIAKLEEASGSKGDK